MLTAAWAAITGFFWRYVAYIALGGFVALAATAGVLWLQKAAAEKKLDAEQLKTERLQTNLDNLNQVLIGKNDGLAELEEALRQRERETAELNAILEDVRNAPTKDDGSVSPLLDRALRQLGGGVQGRNPAR